MKQAQLNREMRDAGKARFWARQEKAIAKGRSSETMAAQRLINGALPGLIEGLEAWIAKADTGKAGKNHGALRPLTELSAPLVCFLGIRAVFDNLSKAPSYSKMVNSIGKHLECESRMAFYKDADPDYFAFLELRSKKMQMIDTMVRYRFFHGEMQQRIKDSGMVDFTPWGTSARVACGVVFLDLVITSTGLMELQKDFSKNPKRPRLIVTPTEAMNKWVSGFNAYAELLHPVFLPTVVPPEEWTPERVSCSTGTDEVYSLPLMKTLNKDLLRDLEAHEMPEVYQALNALQNTAWKVNQRVLEAAEGIWLNDLAIAGIERKADAPLPVPDEDKVDDEVYMKAIRRERGRVRTLNAKTAGRTIGAGKTLATAKLLKDEPEIFFPHQVDFRGRMYPVPSYLQPQGNDLAKGLLQFARGQVITHPEQANWLAIQCANTWGEDKVTMEERIAWTYGHRAEILSVAADPLADLWWTEADSPFQFLASAFEWARWLSEGVGMMTYLPVGVDGTNNGLQILSLLCRDRQAGLSTNVVPSDTVQDIYGDVAKVVEKAMITDMEDSTLAYMADFWIRFGITRKTCKRPVMVFPYGGTFKSCMDYIHEWYEESIEGKDDPLKADRDEKRKILLYLSKHVWAAIQSVVGLPKGVMTWLRSAAQAVNATGQPIEWNAPSGLRVLQRYVEPEGINIKTLLGNTSKWVRLTQDSGVLSNRRQINGISPNYVHSLDAAALARTISHGGKAGIQSWHMVHDSYGTHCTHMDELGAALRFSFYEIFSRDLLAELKVSLETRFEVALEPLPPYGDMDPSSVLQSEFFFA